MINVMLVDDHHLVRSGIRRLLDDVAGIKVIDEADSGEAAIRVLRKKKPDVVLMDVNMPGMGGIEATRKMHRLYPDLKIIAITVYGEEPFPTQLMKAGAVGYLTKGCDAQEMTHAIKTVCRGKRYISMDVAQHLAMTLLPGGDASPFESLSHREMEVMLMVTKGRKVPEISDKLCISPKTVSTYRYRLFEKLGVDSDVELTHLAMRYGMIDSAEDKDTD